MNFSLLLHQHLKRAYLSWQQMGIMATLSDLVTAISAVTGLPEATVFAYGRFARQAGLITQKGRGRSAASMSRTDAANLLIAVAATGVTRDAGRAIRIYRSLSGGTIYDRSGEYTRGFAKWLEPLGVKRSDVGYRLKGDFGRFMEFLIGSTLNGDLAAVFRPEFEREFGADIRLDIRFSRHVPAVELDFVRMRGAGVWMSFGPSRAAQARSPHALRVTATFNQHTLAAVGLVLGDIVKPSEVASHKPMDFMFSQQLNAWRVNNTSIAWRGTESW
jgi:hypothetical protein